MDEKNYWKWETFRDLFLPYEMFIDFSYATFIEKIYEIENLESLVEAYRLLYSDSELAKTYSVISFNDLFDSNDMNHYTMWDKVLADIMQEDNQTELSKALWKTVFKHEDMLFQIWLKNCKENDLSWKDDELCM